jgi:hypothetical protein
MKKQLLHPEGKKAIAMDITKYEILKTSFLACLKEKKTGSFAELSEAVESYMKKKKLKIEGNLSWNLFSVTLDLEARNEIKRDKKVSPMLYFFPK